MGEQEVRSLDREDPIEKTCSINVRATWAGKQMVARPTVVVLFNRKTWSIDSSNIDRRSNNDSTFKGDKPRKRKFLLRKNYKQTCYKQITVLSVIYISGHSSE
jgi:hypothetical protein